MKPSDFKELLYEKENATGIVTVTMNMPKRRNAQSLYTFLEFWWAADAFLKDDSAYAMHRGLSNRPQCATVRGKPCF